jgi:hypothetical protein
VYLGRRRRKVCSAARSVFVMNYFCYFFFDVLFQQGLLGHSASTPTAAYAIFTYCHHMLPQLRERPTPAAKLSPNVTQFELLHLQLELLRAEAKVEIVPHTADA